MENNKEGNSRQVRDAALKRRNFIVTRMRKAGRLLLSDIRAEFKGTKPSQIDEDISQLNKLGLPYKIQDGSEEIIDPDEVFNKGLANRYELNGREKGLLTDLVLSLLVGIPDECKVSTTPREGSIQIEQFFSINAIESSIREIAKHFGNSDDSPSYDRLVNDLIKKWRSMLREQSRMVAIEAGTTLERLAQKLARLNTPVIGTDLVYLTVCTNSRIIFQTLGGSEVPIRTIVIGGQQRGKTQSIAGGLAEMFVRTASLLQFGCGIVGATSVDVETGYCYADSQEDAIMKGLLLSKSALRILVVDNNKLGAKLTGGGYAAFALDRKFIDLVVTNAPLLPEKLGTISASAKAHHLERSKSFEGLVNTIIERGVPVLVATDPGQTSPFAFGAPTSQPKSPIKSRSRRKS